MGRDYSVEDYLATIEAIRTALPRAAISTDLMIGFPGEDGGEFDFFAVAEHARVAALLIHARGGDVDDGE